VGMITPLELMVIPSRRSLKLHQRSQEWRTSQCSPHNQEVPLIFKLMDSNGMPMPDEISSVNVVEPEGTAILTGDDFLYRTIASLCCPENATVPVVITHAGRLGEKDREGLQSYSKVYTGQRIHCLIGCKRALDVTEVERIEGDNLCEITWRFTADMWQNGTAGAVLSGTKQQRYLRPIRRPECTTFR